MKTKLFLLIACTAICAAFISCEPKDKDTAYPVIEDQNFLPANCDIYYLGDTIQVHFVATDNIALGAFNIEIHNNFDHHTHGTSSEECDEGEEHQHEGEEGEEHHHEEVEGAWIYNHDFAFRPNSMADTVDLSIVVPDTVKTGDYHFMLRITDKAGWQSIKAVALEIITSNP